MRSGLRELRAETLVEVICAMHLTNYVPGLGMHRGGLWLVGPPGVMKSTFLDFLEVYEDALFMTDLNNKGLMAVKGELATGTVKTLVFPELQRIYERDPRTALGVEGSIRAMAEEGFRGASFEESGINRFKARATIIGAMTSDLQELKWAGWKTSGFSRRFLWCLIKLKDPEVLMRAVEKWERKDIGNIRVPNAPSSGQISPHLTEAQRKAIRILVRYQPHPNNVSFELMCKIACVLQWHYKQRRLKKSAMATLREFAACLGNSGMQGADVVL